MYKQTPKQQEIFMKKQKIALTALALLASSASYGCNNSYNFYFNGCDEQRQKAPMAQCHNTAPLTSPLAMPMDSTQQQYTKLGLAVVEALDAFFSRNLKDLVAGDDSFDAPNPAAQLKEAAAAKRAAAAARTAAAAAAEKATAATAAGIRARTAEEEAIRKRTALIEAENRLKTATAAEKVAAEEAKAAAAATAAAIERRTATEIKEAAAKAATEATEAAEAKTNADAIFTKYLKAATRNGF